MASATLTIGSHCHRAYTEQHLRLLAGSHSRAIRQSFPGPTDSKRNLHMTAVPADDFPCTVHVSVQIHVR